MRRPARKATTRKSGTRQAAVPRSGSRAMRKASSATAAPGRATSRRPRVSCRYSENTLATNTAAASFTSSDGCSWKPPITIQRRVPAMTGAKRRT